MRKERLRIENLKKGTLLKQLWIQMFEGEIMYMIFDNIQEKDMFLEIISGEIKCDYGKVYYEEQRVEDKKIRQLFKSKVAIIEKDSALIESISLVENVFLMQSEVSGSWICTRKFKKKLKEIFEEFQVDIDVEKPMYKLTPFEKVQIEVMKAYLMGKKILILTALGNTLSNREKESLMNLTQKIKDKGISCVFVEPLEDVDFNNSDIITIIKHGRTCAVKDVVECDYTMLYTMLYYNEVEKRGGEGTFFFERKEVQKGIEIRELCSSYLKNISISIDKGEIVKLFCMDERSYEEIIGVFCGKVPICSGHMITGVERKEIGQMVGLKDGIGIIEGNSAISTLFPDLSALDNLQLLLSQKATGVWMKRKYKRSIKILLSDIIDEDMWKKSVKDLETTEIQKVLYSRWLLYSPKILVCIQPFAEGDIQARETAREMIYNLQKRKIPLLIVSSNTAELNYCSGKSMYIYHGEVINKEEAYKFLYSN